MGPWGEKWRRLWNYFLSFNPSQQSLRSRPLHVFDLQKDEADEDRLNNNNKQNHKVAVFHNVELQGRANYDIK